MEEAAEAAAEAVAVVVEAAFSQNLHSCEAKRIAVAEWLGQTQLDHAPAAVVDLQLHREMVESMVEWKAP